MMSNFRIVALVLALGASIAAAGCGADASLSPTGPSTGTGGGTGAVITGVVIGGGLSASSIWDERLLATADTPSSIKVTVTGTNISTTTDGQGRFTLTGVPGGNVELEFTGPAANAKITLSGVSTSDRIDIRVTINGNNARVESENRRRDENHAEVEGMITARDVSARTLRVGTKEVNVPATAVIRRGDRRLAFADLQVGDRVEVKGKMNGAVLVADEVKVEEDDDDDEDDERNEAEVNGAVSSLTGTCPALNFTVQGKKVVTTMSTSFRDIACTAIRNGTVVEVKGTRQADGSIAATRVERED
jgi:hypothetical protein